MLRNAIDIKELTKESICADHAERIDQMDIKQQVELNKKTLVKKFN